MGMRTPTQLFYSSFIGWALLFAYLLAFYQSANTPLRAASITDLLEWRDYYRREVNEIKKRERLKHGKRTKSTILGRF